jgi:cytochrome P450
MRVRIAAAQPEITVRPRPQDAERACGPDRLDVARRDVHHLSFSHGIHFCLGAPLARMEGQIAISALVRRFPDMRPATDKLEWGDNLILRGLRSLPVTL